MVSRASRTRQFRSPVMAIITDPTQRSAGQTRTDRSTIDAQTTSRPPSRDRLSGGLHDSTISSLSGERSTGRLRPVSSSSLHETVAPDRQPSQSPDMARKLSPSEFNTAMVHFYRGEVQRSNAWRTRLDTTTYWAVFTSAATLSFAFSSASNPHFLIPINSILVAIFLVMEARRYRYYEIWASRVRVIETGYFAQMLAPDGVARDQEWASHLASDLLTPHFTISEKEAIGRRLRRNYIWIFMLLALSWNLKVYLYPAPAANFDEFLQRVTSWTRAASSVPRATVRRAKRARQRLRGGGTKIDITQTPDRRIHVSETPDRRIHIYETPDRVKK